MASCEAIEVLRDALCHQEQCIDQRGRQQHVEERARHVDPKIADRSGGGPLDAADERHSNSNAHSSASEVVVCEAHHLCQIAHGDLRHVRLPVGVRGKAGSSVKGQVWAYGGQTLRIPGQMILQPLNRVGHEHADCREPQHAECVLAPVHFLVRIDPREPVNQPLKRAQHKVQPCAFPFQHLGQIDANRPSCCEENEREDGKLQPTVGGHVRTSPGRAR